MSGFLGTALLLLQSPIRGLFGICIATSGDIYLSESVIISSSYDENAQVRHSSAIRTQIALQASRLKTPRNLSAADGSVCLCNARYDFMPGQVSILTGSRW